MAFPHADHEGAVSGDTPIGVAVPPSGVRRDGDGRAAVSIQAIEALILEVREHHAAAVHEEGAAPVLVHLRAHV